VTAATTTALLVTGEGACCIPRVVIVGRQCGHAGGESVDEYCSNFDKTQIRKMFKL
jgi:F420-0:gamma-glutamyl ligase